MLEGAGRGHRVTLYVRLQVPGDLRGRCGEMRGDLMRGPAFAGAYYLRGGVLAGVEERLGFSGSLAVRYARHATAGTL